MLFRRFHSECAPVFTSTPNVAAVAAAAAQQREVREKYVELTPPSVTFEEFKRAVEEEQETSRRRYSSASAATAGVVPRSPSANRRSHVPATAATAKGAAAAAAAAATAAATAALPPSRLYFSSGDKITAAREKGQQQRRLRPLGVPPSPERLSVRSSGGGDGGATWGASTPPPSPPERCDLGRLSSGGGGSESTPDLPLLPPPRSPRVFESPSKTVLAQAALRARSRSAEPHGRGDGDGDGDGGGDGGSRSTSIASAAAAERPLGRLLVPPPDSTHHMRSHDERLRGLLQGLRVRAKASCSFALALRGQIAEADALMREAAEQEARGEPGFLRVSALRTQRCVWQSQLVEFLTSPETFAPIRLTQMPPRRRCLVSPPSPSPPQSAAAAAVPVDERRGDSSASPSARLSENGDAAPPVAAAAPKVKMLRRGEGLQRIGRNLEQRRLREQQAAATAEKTAGGDGRARARNPATAAAPRRSASATAAGTNQPRRAPTAAGAATARATPRSAPVRRHAEPTHPLVVFTSPVHGERAALIERHIASVVASAAPRGHSDKKGAPGPIANGVVSSAFLDTRRAHFLASLFPAATEMGLPGGSSAGVARIGRDGAFFNEFDHRRFHEICDAIQSL